MPATRSRAIASSDRATSRGVTDGTGARWVMRSRSAAMAFRASSRSHRAAPSSATCFGDRGVSWYRPNTPNRRLKSRSKVSLVTEPTYLRGIHMGTASILLGRTPFSGSLSRISGRSEAGERGQRSARAAKSGVTPTTKRSVRSHCRARAETAGRRPRGRPSCAKGRASLSSS